MTAYYVLSPSGTCVRYSSQEQALAVRGADPERVAYRVPAAWRPAAGEPLAQQVRAAGEKMP